MMMTIPEDFKAKLLNGPALAPPPGVTAQLVDPPNLHHLTIAIFALCICLATVALLLRVGTKLFIIRQLAVEDCMFSSQAGSKYNDTDVSQIPFC